MKEIEITNFKTEEIGYVSIATFTLKYENLELEMLEYIDVDELGKLVLISTEETFEILAEIDEEPADILEYLEKELNAKYNNKALRDYIISHRLPNPNDKISIN